MVSIARVLIAVAILAAAQGAVWWIGEGAPAADIAPTVAAIEALPRDILHWRGLDENLDEDVFVATDAKFMLSRTYSSVSATPINVSIGVWNDQGVSLPHTPEICYVSNGWEMMDRRVMPLETDDGETIDVRYLMFRKDGVRTAVIYWGQVGGQTAVGRDGIQKGKQAHRLADTMPPTIKVHLHTTLESGDRAADDLFEFAAELRKIVRDIK